MPDQKAKKPKINDAERHKRFVDAVKERDGSDKIADFDRAFAKPSHGTTKQHEKRGD